MKTISLAVLLLALSGCTHITVSNIDLLKLANTPQTKYSDADLQTFSLNIEASQDCYSNTVGNITTTSCSNKGRIMNIVSIFKDRGLKAIPGKEGNETSTPHISVISSPINGFLERTTGVFNILTLGLSPLYHYDDYIVTYTDPNTNVVISKQVRVSSTTTWFSLLRSSPKELQRGSIKIRAEEGLIRNVLDEAQIGQSIKSI